MLDYYRDVVLYRVYSYAKNYGTTMTTLLKSGVLGTSYDTASTLTSRTSRAA